MENKNFDETIKKAVFQGTNESVELKDKIWENIQSKINDDNKGEIIMRSNNRKLKKRKKWIQYGSIAAILTLVIGAGTETGQATIKKVKEFLVPEKVITEEIEGMKEKTNMNLNEREMGYSIYFDEDRYMIKDYNGADRIIPKPIEGRDFSEIYYMEIKEEKNKTPEEMAKEIESKLKEEFEYVNEIENVSQPIEGLAIIGVTYKGNFPVAKYYFLSNNKGGTYVFKQQLTVEAEEGLGVRFDNMLKEFRIQDNIK